MSNNASPAEFEAVFDALDVGIVLLDREARIVGWNEWLDRVSGHSKPAVLGKRLYDLFPELQDTRLPTSIEDAIGVGSSSVLTHSLNRLLPLRGEDGRELLHNIVVRPIFSGGSRHCLLQINDVTISVTRERVLRDRQNARYHAIVDSAPDAIITTGLDRTIHWVNGAAEQIFGYRATELLGQKIDVLLDQAENLDAAFAGEGVESRATGVQVVGHRKQGDLAHFEVSFGRWRADDRVFLTTIWRDVTERI